MCPSLWETGGTGPSASLGMWAGEEQFVNDLSMGNRFGLEPGARTWEISILPCQIILPCVSSVQPTQTTLQPHSPTSRQVLNSFHLNYLLLKAQCNWILWGTEILKDTAQLCRAAQTPTLCPGPGRAAATSGVCCAGAAIPGKPLHCCLRSQAINSLPKLYHYPGRDAAGMVRLIQSAEDQLKDGAAPGCSSFPLSFVLFST